MTLKTSYFNLFLDIWIADILQSGAAGVKANFPLLPTVIKTDLGPRSTPPHPPHTLSACDVTLGNALPRHPNLISPTIMGEEGLLNQKTSWLYATQTATVLSPFAPTRFPHCQAARRPRRCNHSPSLSGTVTTWSCGYK